MGLPSDILMQPIRKT